MSIVFRCLKIWSMLRGWWEKSESDKRNCNFMTKTWRVEMQELPKRTVVLLREIKFSNKKWNSIKNEEWWSQKLKLREQKICKLLINHYRNNKANLTKIKKIFTSKHSSINKQCEKNIKIITERWQKKKKILISLTFKLFETKKQTCIQWFQESITSTLSAPIQWIESETQSNFQLQGLKLFYLNFIKTLKTTLLRMLSMTEVSPLICRSNRT